MRANGTQDPLRLEGLRQGINGEDDVLVTDAHGRLRYRPIADLTLSGEWEYNGTSHIYARRADGSGNDVVVTNSGRFGIGSTSPQAAFHLDIGGDLVSATSSTGLRIGSGGDFLGADENEIQAFESNAPGRLNLNVDGGSVVLGSNTPNTLLFDLYGRARVRNLPTGDVDNSNPDDRIVTADANGNLRAVTRDDLETGEWRNHSSDAYIYAKRADDASNDVVVTDAGDFGIGTVSPGAKLHTVNGGIIAERGGTNVNGAFGNREALRVTGDDRYGDGVLSTNDNQALELKYNATGATGTDQFMGNQDRFASRIFFDGDPRTLAVNGFDRPAFGISVSSVAGASGTGISWRTPFVVDNGGQVGIGTTDPTADFHISGPNVSAANPESAFKIRRGALPTGTINGVPATDPEVLLLDPISDEVKRISASDLFDDEGEWVDHGSGDYIYARRARDEGTTDYVVIDDDGRMGMGTTAPEATLHVDDGGIRLDDRDFGISFNSESPNWNLDPTTDGSRIYNQQGAFGGWQDALIIEKTDFNNNAVDGGVAFANRQAGNNRVINMVVRGDGDVGIGNNLVNPTERLHVLGNGLFQDANGGTGTNADAGLIKIVDDANVFGDYRRGVQIGDGGSNGGNGEVAYFGMEPRATGSDHDAAVMWGNDVSRDLHFTHLNGGTPREVMTLDGQSLSVGIGTALPLDGSVRLDVGGRVRVRDLDEQTNYDESSDLIVIADNLGNLQTVTADVFKQDFEDLDWTIAPNDEIYNANSGAVGIGVTNPENSVKLHVNGDVRLENASALQLDDGDVRLFAPNDGQLSIEAHTTTTFENRSATGIDPMVVDHNAGTLRIGAGRASNQLSALVDGGAPHGCDLGTPVRRQRKQHDLRRGRQRLPGIGQPALERPQPNRYPGRARGPDRQPQRRDQQQRPRDDPNDSREPHRLRR